MDAAQKKRVMAELQKAARKVFSYKPSAKSEKEEHQRQERHRTPWVLREEPKTCYGTKKK